MTERKLYQDIPGGKNSFHSAVLTSFSFSFHHFENQVLRTLKQKWITSVNILVDQRMLDDTLGLSSGQLKNISQTYSISGMQSQGAFHPKINFFIGDKELLVLFGSGNITAGGHGKNHEIFTGLYANSEDHKQLPLILETWQYLQLLTKDIDGYVNERIGITLPSACSLLTSFSRPKHQFYSIDDKIEIALLYNDETSISDQILSLIKPEGIKKIVIICPYYDEDGSTLINFMSKYPNADLAVFLQEEFGLPPNKINNNKRIKFFNWNNTERGQKKIGGKNKYKRKLHGKIFLFSDGETEYCLIGSANATVNGLGSPSKKAVNQEFGALYKSNEIDFYNELGLNGKKIEVDVKNLIRPSNISGDLPTNIRKTKYRIKVVDLKGNKLRIFLEKPLKEKNQKLKLFKINGDDCFEIDLNVENSTTLEIRLSENELRSNLKYCLIADENNETISNKQLINFLDKLDNTNPSESNRTIRQIISTIEGGQINEFEIAEFLNELNENGNIRKNNSKNTRRGKQENELTKDDASEMTYEEAVDRAKNSEDLEKIIHTNSTSRILYSISHLFEIRRDTLIEELMDEEEEGDATKSRVRVVESTVRKKVQFKNISLAQIKLKCVEKMASNYITSIQSFGNTPDHLLDILDYHQLLLVSHILTTVCCFTEYELLKDQKENEWKLKLKDKYQTLMLEILKQFAILCQKCKKKVHDDQELGLHIKQSDAIQKVINNVVLNLNLIECKCGEQFIVEQIYLIGLNIFHSCGIPGNSFETYIENVSKNQGDIYFSTRRVMQLNDKLLRLMEDDNTSFIWIPNHGYCKVIEMNNHELRFKSLYGVYQISKSKIKGRKN